MKWKICSKCKKRGKRFRRFGNKKYCFQCYQKVITIVPGGDRANQLREALSREYEIKSSLTNGKLIAFKHFPSILAGKKVKLVLIK